MLFNREMSDSEAESLPFETEEAATNLVSSLFPDKSKTKYEKRFTDWCASKKINHDARQKVLLPFFEDLSKSYKCSSLWAVCEGTEGYIDISIENKKKTASDILGGDPGARTRPVATTEIQALLEEKS
ncbi:hypothetical protein Zmor_023402 [Zophobas morio]|uniref:Uncharacterized protein n=1 Tax=Zophobas morio TaxID=2755281 RepID=A0AA38HYN1_9CUCU|nr:hypothetical protein Zmor_023402 [Zophobas morio]